MIIEDHAWAGKCGGEKNILKEREILGNLKG
jgi:hypothetical protein